MANIEISPIPLSSWRKIALGTWRAGGDPSVYGVLEINASKILARQKRWGEKKGVKAPTLTVIMAKVAAMTLHKYPELNGLIRWGRLYKRKNVAIFLQTTVDDHGKELSGVTIHDAETKAIDQFMQELASKARAIREDKDPNFKRAKSTFKWVPVLLMRPALDFISFLLYTLNLDLRWLGLPKDPFGSIMITSIGMLGLDEAFAPLVAYSKVPVLLAIGAIREKAIVLDGKIEVAPMFNICITLDHRFIDGLYGSKMAKHMRWILETEEGLDSLGL